MDWTVESTATQKQRSEKRTRIIDAAIDVFAAKGYRSARISDIARGAGVADGTIYLYFRNKEDLLLTIFEEKMDLVLKELEANLETKSDPIGRIEAFAETHFYLLQTHPALAQVFQVELRQSTRFLTDYRPEPLWAYLDVFESLIRDGQEAGLLRNDVDPFVTKWAFFGALDELSIQWVLSRKRERFKLDEASRQLVSVFLNGIRCE
jgi:TetR/AcrR family fatty acid metabolism transcriptional regulator